MTPTDPGLADALEEAVAGPAPRLPTDGPLVATVLALKEIETSAKFALGLLQHASDQHEGLVEAFRAINVNLQTAWQNYSTFHEVRNCKGQG